MAQVANPVKQRWQAGEPALGAWLMIPSVMTAEEIGRIGYDYVCIDMQHGLIGYQMAVDMIRAINLGSSAPFVRVPYHDFALIPKMLDAGALGIIIPMVNSAAEATEVAAYCRYPPQGQRSHAYTRAAEWQGFAATPAEMNEAVLCIPMVETVEAVAKTAEIARAPGVDAIYVGPGDLSISLGLPPRNNDGNPSFDEALAAILEACAAEDRIAGIQANPGLAAQRVAQGFGLVTVATDIGLMKKTMTESLAALRQS